MTTIAAPTSAPYIAHQPEARWFGDGLFEFLVPNDATGGQLCVFRATLPQGFSPPRHVHTREDEVFVVVDGDAAFEIDGERLSAGPGTSVYMPRGVPHSFLVESASATMLGVMTPGDFEHLFRSLGVPAATRTLPPRGASALEIAAVMAGQRALGTEVVGPPMQG